MDLGAWKVTEEWVRRYLRAVCDDRPEYSESGLAPPLALVVWALGALLKQLDLPAGAVHSLQELETVGPVRLGEEVSANASIDRPRRRGNLEFIDASYALKDGAGQVALRGKTTVLVVDAGTPTSVGRETARVPSLRAGVVGPVNTAETGLPALVKKINQGRLIDYSRASGDYNPLHLDADFAAATQFGGIIAHGMLNLAFISEMMVAAFGNSWLKSGSLRVRFRGAAYLEDELETWGRVTKEEPFSSGRRIACSVGVRNRQSGQELVGGTSTVIIASGEV